MTDAASGAPRPTLDVDVIAEITSYAEYAAFGERLRACGFSEDARPGAPLCMWVHGELLLDVMPLDEKILGFWNRWYRTAMDRAVDRELAADLRVRVVPAPCLIATKIEAFLGRGEGDFFSSHDLEDLLFVIDGRPSIADEVGAEGSALRSYLRERVANLLATPAFLDALPGYLLPDTASQARIGTVLRRLEAIVRVRPLRKRRHTNRCDVTTQLNGGHLPVLSGPKGAHFPRHKSFVINIALLRIATSSHVPVPECPHRLIRLVPSMFPIF